VGVCSKGRRGSRDPEKGERVSLKKGRCIKIEAPKSWPWVSTGKGNYESTHDKSR